MFPPTIGTDFLGVCCQEFDADAQKPRMVHASALQSRCEALFNDVTLIISVADSVFYLYRSHSTTIGSLGASEVPTNT